MLVGDIYMFPALADYSDGGQMLLCNGRAVSRVVYAQLFVLCGVVFGPGDGVTTFNIPHFGNDGVVTGRSPIGANPGGGGYALGATGGLQVHGHACAGVVLNHQYIGGAVQTDPEFGGGVNAEGGGPPSLSPTHRHPLPSLAAITHAGFPAVDNLANVAPYLAMGMFVKAT